ncbi:hypothetical protein LOZ12_003475 [Ophidiomyces ophidiicola]|uniref:uncharacterized protein n=1 Tax=Ophidiomyces ophidiicola TaxID=1387563 RepID=UPI0020C2115C|nr:uncharacterized protein LOZ57_006328 [Ophidiomyces ophidiicola]KAI1938366.1 hypothetical protein LOZ57_006328 [Ophidiomyces ophidiicola]KAI1945042.1 hypothetical protein LOZ62_003908 [Ophidiomyces ophidiicola]KAI2005381.1 hypothetical protein LOZ50_003727 [Ophidiomyces ophidiicola]KAI2066679.1 hypothetical protein LOZ37_006001 [Ophidiomyces ophidiicola]KAI2173135.1 hypothetical protein LOZ24_004853 [Ophidiomyces ophidiicola]
MTTEWERIAAAKQRKLAAAIPAEWRIPDDLLPTGPNVLSFPQQSGWFTAHELAITNAGACEILAQTRSGAWTAEEVTRAFCKRAAAAHQLTNCLSEILFDDAVRTAQALDAQLAETGTPRGPLHGLPVSLKDNFHIAGTDATLGFTALVDRPSACNSILTDVLRAAGAVLFVKTNVPTAMMIAETVNHVTGRTCSPRDRRLAAGGSSGGEAALLACGGSALGVGTDIGGSLRIPAALTGGLFALRPSVGRFPNSATQSALAGQESVLSVNGPLAPSLDALELFAAAVVGSQPWRADPKCVPLPWRPVPAQQRLRVGVLWHDGLVRPTPPVARALAETVDALKRAGHDVVDWAPDGHDDAVELLDRFFLADGGQSVQALLARTGEPMRPEMARYATAADPGVYALWQLHARRNALQLAYLARWNAAGLDALLCPVCPFAAVPHGKFRHVGYTGVFNVLDYACLAFPCAATADQARDVPDTRPPLSDLDRLVQLEYDPAAVHAMPVSLQLVARRLDEERLLMIARRVLDAL